MATLLLRLAAPLQSWGTDSKFEIRKTGREPTKSGIVGLLAAALGIRRDDPEALEPLNRLRFGVRVDQEGSLLVDFHMAKNEKTSYVTRRQYLADAVFLAGLESEDRGLLEELAAALSHPAFPLFLGRRSCPPSQPLCLGIREGSLEAALQAEPWQAPSWRQRGKRELRMVMDAQPGEAGAGPQADVALSFHPVHRRYGYRPVREVLTERPPVIPADTTEQDPFAELR